VPSRFVLTCLTISLQRSEFLDALEEAQAENAELTDKLAIAEEESEEKRTEMEEIIRECEELEIEITRNNKLQSAARQQAAALKKRYWFHCLRGCGA
jgi:predicted nuclease with TOPRIM domain